MARRTKEEKTMEWKIDTSTTGEVKAADLRAALEASQKHWFITQGKLASLQAGATLGPGPEAKSDMAGAQEHFKKVGELSEALERAHAEDSKKLHEEMAIGIDLACQIATLYGGKVTASISGHNDERHPSACGRRMSVAVDQTWDE